MRKKYWRGQGDKRTKGIKEGKQTIDAGRNETIIC
jgi:hypothetical protein